jgi:hypothetical protein
MSEVEYLFLKEAKVDKAIKFFIKVVH